MAGRGPFAWVATEHRLRMAGHIVAIVVLAYCLVVPIWLWLAGNFLAPLPLLVFGSSGEAYIPLVVGVATLLPAAIPGLLGLWVTVGAARLRKVVPLLEGCFALAVCLGQLWVAALIIRLP